MSFIESISAARAFAAKDDPPVDADRELLALGAANLAGGLFQAYPAGGGTSQTAVNDGAGARTQLAEVVTAVVAVLTLTLLAGLLADLAQAILGAIVLVAAIGLVNLAPLRRMRTIRRRDFWLGLVALAGVLVLGVLPGVLVAVLISLLVLLHEPDHPRVVASERAPGLLVVRPEGRLFFANARRVFDHIAALAADHRPPPRWCLSTSAPSTTSRSPPWNGWPTRPRSCIVRAAPCGRPGRANGRRRCSAAPASCSAAPTCRPTPDASASGSSRASRRRSPPTSSRPCRTTR
jgi:MFS superfamily sulfate permease-like transporter